MVGTQAPHSPPEVADRYQNSFADTPLPQPPNFNEADVSDKPAVGAVLPSAHADEIDKMQDAIPAAAALDALRGRPAEADHRHPRETGELDNTYIFFTSDNGYHSATTGCGGTRRRPTRRT